MKLLPCSISVAMALTMFAACGNDEPQPTPVQLVEIVTVMDGEKGLFALERRGSQEPVLLIADYGVSVTEGTRVLMQFTHAAADSLHILTPVHLQRAWRINFDTIRAMDMARIRKLPPGQVTLTSQWVTRKFVNCQAEMLYDGAARGFRAVADAATLERDTVECYLTNTGAPVGDASVQALTYGSFYIGLVCTRPGQTVRLHENCPSTP